MLLVIAYYNVSFKMNNKNIDFHYKYEQKQIYSDKDKSKEIKELKEKIKQLQEEVKKAKQFEFKF